ncbi:MAG: hypothetical protein AMXMBFR4_32410 [Candidatus Hydrogenedentota bacterium]
MFRWYKRRRRARIREQPFPDEWESILQRNVPYYNWLPPDLQSEMRGLVQIFIDEKNIEGCGGLELTDEIRVTVAAHACTLLLRREHDCYPNVRSVLVYPDEFVVPGDVPIDENEFLDEDDARIGESWEFGVVIVAWKPLLRAIRRPHEGMNVVLHEFAHQLDIEDGVTDGVPFFDDDDANKEWADVMSGAYEQLWRDIERNRDTFIDEYGATNPAEFFAVLTETFFERPHTLQRRHPELYEVLQNYYRQDPAAVRPRV